MEDLFLLADDIRELLATAGAEIVGPFATAEAALAGAEQHKPACAVVDINLGSGADFAPARALLARDVPVIFVTGYGRETVPAELSGLPHVNKPVHGPELVRAVRSAWAAAGGK